MITRPVRRLMALQALAGVSVGVCAAAGIPLTGGTATGFNLAIFAPTAAIQIRPAIRNASLPLHWFLPLTICSAALALACWAVFSSIGVALGVMGWLSVAEPAVRTEVLAYLGAVGPTAVGLKSFWKAIR